VVAPMLVSPVSERPAGEEWAFEVRWDGRRALVSVDPAVRVRSRPGHDHTDAFSELAVLESLAGRVVACAFPGLQASERGRFAALVAEHGVEVPGGVWLPAGLAEVEVGLSGAFTCWSAAGTSGPRIPGVCTPAAPYGWACRSVDGTTGVHSTLVDYAGAGFTDGGILPAGLHLADRRASYPVPTIAHTNRMAAVQGPVGGSGCLRGAFPAARHPTAPITTTLPGWTTSGPR
jgi:hypothetical protein